MMKPLPSSQWLKGHLHHLQNLSTRLQDVSNMSRYTRYRMCPTCLGIPAIGSVLHCVGGWIKGTALSLNHKEYSEVPIGIVRLSV